MKTKLFAIVMSAMMVLCFMPTMAFAATGANCSIDGTNEASIESVAIGLYNQTVEGKYKLVDTATVMSTISGNSDYTIIDTMPQSFFDQHHVKGAVCVFVNKSDQDGGITKDQKTALKAAVGYKAITKKTSKATKNKILKERKTKKIVCYCGFVKCTRSHEAAKYLVSLGYKNVYRYAGGYAALDDSGYEFEATQAAA